MKYFKLQQISEEEYMNITKDWSCNKFTQSAHKVNGFVYIAINENTQQVIEMEEI